MNAQQDTHRLHFLLETVEREGRRLVFTSRRLLGQPIDSDWVEALQDNPDLAERLDAFVARFARMQDTIGDRVIPQLRKCMLETPEAAFDNLNRMEKLGLLSSVTDWVEARNLRNRLIHEYMRDPQEFAGALVRAGALVALLVSTYNSLCEYAKSRFASSTGQWPATIKPVP